MFIISLVYVLSTSTDLLKETGFALKKTRNSQYPTETMTDADDFALLSNTPTVAREITHA